MSRIILDLNEEEYDDFKKAMSIAYKGEEIYLLNNKYFIMYLLTDYINKNNDSN